MSTIRCPNCKNLIKIDIKSETINCTACGKMYRNIYYIHKRDVGKSILLIILTLGIYGLVWFVKLTNDINKLEDKDKNIECSGGFALLLLLLTFGIYRIYWAYKHGERLDIAKQNHGMKSKNSEILYMLLSICGLDIIVWALMQNQLNEIANV